MTKQEILEKVKDLTAEQLFEGIKAKTVSRIELMQTGGVPPVKRREIDSMIEELNSTDDSDWTKYKDGGESELKKYLEKYADHGNHSVEAIERINSQKKQMQEELSNRTTIIEELSKNTNNYKIEDIYKFIKNGILKIDDLKELNIPDDVIEIIQNIGRKRANGEKEFDLKDCIIEKAPESIPDGYTEVYFWGGTGSGKTCALGALLSTAENESLLEIATSPGYDFMVQLKNIFNDDYPILPKPTNVDITQYLPFVLKKDKDNPKSVSLIELSGEIFECFFNVNAGKKLPTDLHQQTFDNLMNYLNGKNRKIHFFFIDYEKENKRNKKGYTQSDYLNAASTFFNDNNIFANSTDAIYLIITKSDLMPCSKDEKSSYIRQYLSNNNYSAFVNTLKNKCKKHSINGGELTFEPFSLGQVYFKEICEFDRSASNTILNILLSRVKSNKKCILDHLRR